MVKNKNSNPSRGAKEGPKRKRVLALVPKASNPSLLTRVWRWEEV